MDSAQRVHEKNGVICLVVMFTPRIRVIRMSQIAHFLNFLLITAKKIVTVFAKYLMHSWDVEGRNLRITAESAQIT